MLKLLYESIGYVENVNKYGEGGVCVGHCVTWLLDIFESKTSLLLPPEFLRPLILQRKFNRVRINAGLSEISYMSKVVAYTLAQTNTCQRDFESREAIGCTVVKAEIEKFSDVQGNAGMMLAWGENSNSDGHITAMLKLKHDGRVLFYDPNFGVYLWDRKSTPDSLYKSVKAFMQPLYGASFRLKMGLGFKTGLPLMINAYPVT